MRIVSLCGRSSPPQRAGLEYDIVLVTRTLFGAGEAGAFPNMTRIFTTGCRRGRGSGAGHFWLARGGEAR